MRGLSDGGYALLALKKYMGESGRGGELWGKVPHSGSR